MYESGHGVAKDAVFAVSLYRKSADQGDTYGEDALGLMYEYGKVVPQDYAKAHELYAKSAANGDAWAKNALKRLCATRNLC
jgi:hypothetical protein